MSFTIAATVDQVRHAVAEARRVGRTIGLVPTMGALHDGHLALIRAAREETRFVVVSIFVNPTQFSPHEDLTRYPRPLEKDLDVCIREGVDVAFVPSVETVYPPGFRTFVEVTGLQDVLEGASRPGHFRGVATVVLKLFLMVGPDRVYFGQKDAQQVRIVRQMIDDLNVPVELRVCPTVREADGLALSSRNQYLDAGQRRQAVVLSQALQHARERVEDGERDPAALEQMIRAIIAQAADAAVDSVAVVDAGTLAPVERLQGEVLVALAVRFGTTRLIDNLCLRVAD